MGDLSRAGETIVGFLERLVWIATEPRNLAHPEETKHTGVEPVHECVGTMGLGVIESQGVLEVHLSKSQVPADE